VIRATTAMPRYLFTGRGGQVLRHVPSFAKLYWRLFRDRRVSLLPKALLVLLAVYLLSPLDFVPELIPVVGAVDDLVLGAGGLWFFIRLCPPPVVREHVTQIAAESRGEPRTHG
jgi:uncharacterized membrane protein YkvA (DUF1232 family)